MLALLSIVWQIFLARQTCVILKHLCCHIFGQQDNVLKQWLTAEYREGGTDHFLIVHKLCCQRRSVTTPATNKSNYLVCHLICQIFSISCLVSHLIPSTRTFSEKQCWSSTNHMIVLSALRTLGKPRHHFAHNLLWGTRLAFHYSCPSWQMYVCSSVDFNMLTFC